MQCYDIQPPLKNGTGFLRLHHGSHGHAATAYLHHFSAYKILLFLLVFISALFYLQPARADFRVCNTTNGLVGVAIGYRSDVGWISEGWWHIPATSCKTLIEGNLTARYYYIFAEDTNRTGRWSGSVNMCVGETEFKINGVENCFARGYQRFGFQEIDTGAQTSWMLQLSNENSMNIITNSEAIRSVTP